MRTTSRTTARNVARCSAISLLAALALFATSDALAQRDTPNLSESSSDKTLDRRLQSLYRQIRCPVCPAQPISESEAPLSRILREELRTQIVAGKSEEEALSWLVERYGEGVLLRPRFDSAALLWLAPVLCVLIALGVLRAYTKRRRVR